MAEQYLGQPLQAAPAPAPREPDTKQPGWLYGDALSRTLRSQADPWISKFRGYWDYLLGKDHWPNAITTTARRQAEWSFRGVINDMYAVIDTKTSIITGSKSSVTVKPRGDSTELQRLQIKAVIEDEMDRVGHQRIKKDVYQWGSATGLGVAMWTKRPDSITGDEELVLQSLNPAEVFCDSDCFETANVWVWYPLLKMSQWRKMWPEDSKRIKTDLNQTSVPSGVTNKPDNTDENLIYGNAGEYSVDTHGIKERKARGAFIWIKDPDSVIEELRETVIREAMPGLRCVSCGYIFDPDSMPDGLTQDFQCPNCAGDLESVMIPPKTKTDKIVQRAYPYGRLIVISGETLLYDGENPYEVEEVFPGAAYHHYRVPGTLYGAGDVALLKSLQEETDATVGQIIDYVRLCVNGPFIYPMGFKSISQLGNGPGERHPGPDQAGWLPQFVTPNGFNVQAYAALIGTLERHFLTVSGVGDLSGAPSSPAISATEVEVTANRTSNRMKGHAGEFGLFLSRLGSIQYQLMKQVYTTKRVNLSFAPTHLQSVEIQMQDLPDNVSVTIDLSLEAAQMDKLQKQVLQGFIAQGGLQHPDADLLLETFGASPTTIKELMSRKSLRQEQGIPEPNAPPMGEPATTGAIQ